MDPYGRFSLANCRGGYPVEVEFPDGYQVLEDPAGSKVILSPHGTNTNVGAALRDGFARII
jgi:virulence-associated protein VagC